MLYHLNIQTHNNHIIAGSTSTPGMPTLMTQQQLNDSLSAASKEADKLKHQGPVGQGDTAADQTQDHAGILGGGTNQPPALSQAGMGQDVQYYFTDGQLPMYQKECEKCGW